MRRCGWTGSRLDRGRDSSIQPSTLTAKAKVTEYNRTWLSVWNSDSLIRVRTGAGQPWHMDSLITSLARTIFIRNTTVRTEPFHTRCVTGTIVTQDFSQYHARSGLVSTPCPRHDKLVTVTVASTHNRAYHRWFRKNLKLNPGGWKFRSWWCKRNPVDLLHNRFEGTFLSEV